MELQATIDLIRQGRKRKRYSQSDMADKLNIVLKTYQNIEGGVTKIDLARLSDIARILELPVKDLIIDEHPSPVSLYGQRDPFYERIINEKDHYIAALESQLQFFKEVLMDQKAAV